MLHLVNAKTKLQCGTKCLLGYNQWEGNWVVLYVNEQVSMKYMEQVRDNSRLSHGIASKVVVDGRMGVKLKFYFFASHCTVRGLQKESRG